MTVTDLGAKCHWCRCRKKLQIQIFSFNEWFYHNPSSSITASENLRQRAMENYVMLCFSVFWRTKCRIWSQKGLGNKTEETTYEPGSLRFLNHHSL